MGLMNERENKDFCSHRRKNRERGERIKERTGLNEGRIGGPTRQMERLEVRGKKGVKRIGKHHVIMYSR